MRNELVARAPLDRIAPMLPGFGEKYPGGWDWLEQRLSRVDAGEARAWLSFVGDEIAAFALETPKGRRASKLSTFAVLPAFRRRGVGGGLLDALRRDWLARGIDSVHVTVDKDDDRTQGFFRGRGFVLAPKVTIPYGGLRLDRLFQWEAAGDPLAHAPALH